MKLIRFGAAGAEIAGVELADGTRIDVGRCTPDYGEAFFAADGLFELRRWVDEHGARAPRIDAGTRLGSPLARPSKIVCVGLNFRDHAAESGLPLPSEPVLFFKATTALSGPNDDVTMPRGAAKLDWEVELAVIMGRRASYVTEADALEYVAGYALHNDYSERSFQLERGGQWVKGKSADTFAPLGPYLVTRDEVPDTAALEMWLTVNGEHRQKGHTREMVFGVATLVSYVTEFMTLSPGDILMTGALPDAPRVRAGARVSVEIDGLDRLETHVLEAPEIPA